MEKTNILGISCISEYSLMLKKIFNKGNFQLQKYSLGTSKHCAGKEMHRMKDIPEVSEEHQAGRRARKLQNSIRRKAVQSILGTEKKQQQMLL